MMHPKQSNNQRGMVEVGLIVVLIAVALVAAAVYVKTKRNLESKSTSTAVKTATTTTVSTKDPVLDQAASSADAGVNDLNASYATDTTSGNLKVTQGALQ